MFTFGFGAWDTLPLASCQPGDRQATLQLTSAVTSGLCPASYSFYSLPAFRVYSQFLHLQKYVLTTDLNSGSACGVVFRCGLPGTPRNPSVVGGIESQGRSTWVHQPLSACGQSCLCFVFRIWCKLSHEEGISWLNNVLEIADL